MSFMDQLGDLPRIIESVKQIIVEETYARVPDDMKAVDVPLAQLQTEIVGASVIAGTDKFLVSLLSFWLTSKSSKATSTRFDALQLAAMSPNGALWEPLLGVGSLAESDEELWLVALCRCAGTTEHLGHVAVLLMRRWPKRRKLFKKNGLLWRSPETNYLTTAYNRAVERLR